ncbi:MAG: NUDIX hydrolase [Candidatus Bathyarchaeia archaeon]
MVKRLYPAQPVVGVGAIIVCDGRLLVGKRRSEPGKGKYSVPGGLVELGESPEQAVIREIREETGLEAESPELVDVVNKIVKDENGAIKFHFVIIDYFVKVKGGKLRAADDAEDLKWVPLEELEQYNITDTLREFLRNNMDKLKKLNSCT